MIAGVIGGYLTEMPRCSHTDQVMAGFARALFELTQPEQVVSCLTPGWGLSAAYAAVELGIHTVGVPGPTPPDFADSEHNALWYQFVIESCDHVVRVSATEDGTSDFWTYREVASMSGVLAVLHRPERERYSEAVTAVLARHQGLLFNALPRWLDWAAKHAEEFSINLY